MAAIVALAALAAGLTRLPGLLRVPPAARPVAAWALPWPDLRDGSVPQSVLDRAVIAWRGDNFTGATEPPAGSSASQVARLASRYRVTWYAGQTTVKGEVVVVIFEVDGPAGPQLVAGWAEAADVMQDQPSWSHSNSPWVLTSVPAPKPGNPATVIGMNAHGPGGSATGNPDNWIILLTAPGTSAISWQEAGRAGVLHPDRGLAIKDMGQITAAVQLTQVVTSRNVLRQAEYVGVPGGGLDTPQLAQAPALVPPAGFSEIVEFSGQGVVGGGIDPLASGQHYALASGQHYALASGQHYVVLARCYGPEPLRVFVSGHEAGIVRCDDNQHQLAIPAAWLPIRHAMVTIKTSTLTSWRVSLGTAR